jgi:hypothetical protein
MIRAAITRIRPIVSQAVSSLSCTHSLRPSILFSTNQATTTPHHHQHHAASVYRSLSTTPTPTSSSSSTSKDNSNKDKEKEEEEAEPDVPKESKFPSVQLGLAVIVTALATSYIYDDKEKKAIQAAGGHWDKDVKSEKGSLAELAERYEVKAGPLPTLIHGTSSVAAYYTSLPSSPSLFATKSMNGNRL